ncbi:MULTISPECIES: hypothetical protein [unclassified Exiguobacterium]|uniref:hypothetical protein n=1 Tax=unclassified Exiguobacterium TaxID=2644629 RepID=UPI001BE899E3|nr:MULTISPECIES: hypothetical protein [unclassified Exiguobacterium]
MEFNVLRDGKTVLTFKNGELTRKVGSLQTVTEMLTLGDDYGTKFGEYDPIRPAIKDPLAIRLCCEMYLGSVTFTGDVPLFSDVIEEEDVRRRNE